VINTKKFLRGVKLIFFFIILSSTTLFSQNKQNYKLFKGELVSDSLNVSGLHIINKNSGAKSISDVNGVFGIGVKKNDTIIISSIQTKPKVIVVNENIFDVELVKVYLEPFVNELDNVVVKPHNLSGNMLNDMLDSGIKNPINFSDVGIPGYKGVRKEKIVSGKSLILSTLFLPLGAALDVEAIYKHISGYYKDLKKARVLDRQFDSVVRIMEFYGLVFFINNYDLDEDQVYEFVMGAIENSNIENDFKSSNHNLVLESFDKFYVSINEK